MAMRRVCSPTITLPYWAPTLDDPLNDPTLSVLWTPEFLGDGFNFVESGPFANWTDRSGRVISRNLNNVGALISDRDIQRVIERNTHYHDIFMHPKTVDYANTIEGINYKLHGFVGGSMNRLNTAAFDPVFIFQYAFIDYLFERARENFRMKGFNPATDYPACTGVHDAQALMANFTFFRNIDGLNDIWTNQYFYYDDVPTCSALNRDCGSPYLTCMSQRGQWKCQSKVTNYAFDLSPEVRLASNTLDQQLPGQQFQLPGNNLNPAFPGLNGPSNPFTGNKPSVPNVGTVPNNMGAANQQTFMAPGQIGPRTNPNPQFGQVSQAGPQVAEPPHNLAQGQPGLGQIPSPSNVPNTVSLGSGVSHFGNQMIQVLPVQSHPQPTGAQPPLVNVQQQPQGNLQQPPSVNAQTNHGNLHTGVQSPFNPFEAANQAQNLNSVVGMELPVMAPVGGMELPVIDPTSPNQYDPSLHMNPFDQHPVVAGPELPQGGNPNPPVEPASPPVVINPLPAKPVNTNIGPQPFPQVPPPTNVAPPPRPKAPSVISNLNMLGRPGTSNVFRFNQQPQNSFSVSGRKKRSVSTDLPLPLDNDCTSWIHELAHPIQNTYEIDGVPDSSRWLYVPVAIKFVRSPNRTFEIHGFKNGMSSPYDIYDPAQSSQLQRRLPTEQLPQRPHSSISGSGASKVYLKSDGLSYEGTYTDYVVVDERMPISEYTGYVAIKNPKYGRSETHIAVYDSLGQLCKPRCATSRSRSNPKYRPCSGVIEADSSSPDMAYNSIPEAVMDTWIIKEPYPPRLSRFPYLEYLCDSTNALYWEGCENDRYL